MQLNTIKLEEYGVKMMSRGSKVKYVARNFSNSKV